jgi:hypothetical protein
MASVTEKLQRAFLDALGDSVLSHSSIDAKPLDVNLRLPAPPRLRCYMFSLVSGGPKRSNEFKAVLRVRGQPVGSYGTFNTSDEKLVLVIAYRPDLDVFVLWDASLRRQFKNGGNIQVRATTVYRAAALGRADQTRPLSSATELVIACQSSQLLSAISDRVVWTGSAPEDQWATFPS